MSALVSVLIGAATLAFGAVYPWGYLPLFAAAAGVGLCGLIRQRGVPPGMRAIAVALVFIVLAIAGQLIAVSRPTLALISPHAADLLSRYDLTFAHGGVSHPLSLNAGATARALMGMAALGLYLIGLPGLLSRRDLGSLPRYLIMFAVPLALLGMFGREHNNGLVYGFWQPRDGSDANGFGPFVNRNHFAGWMLMATCLAIGVLLARIESALDRVKPGFRNRLVWCATREANRLVLVAASIFVMTIALVWTLSRSGIVSLTCAMACFAWLLARRRDIGLARRLVGAFGIGVVLAAGLSWRGIDRLTEWFADTTDLLGRFDAWRDGWHVVQDFPTVGTGINTYSDAMLFYQHSNPDVHLAQAHNDYLQLLAEGGLLVALPVAVAVVLLVLAIRRSVSEARHDAYAYWIRAGASVGLVAIAIQETAEFSLQMPANAFLFVTMASIALSRQTVRRGNARQT